LFSNLTASSNQAKQGDKVTFTADGSKNQGTANASVTTKTQFKDGKYHPLVRPIRRRSTQASRLPVTFNWFTSERGKKGNHHHNGDKQDQAQAAVVEEQTKPTTLQTPPLSTFRATEQGKRARSHGRDRDDSKHGRANARHVFFVRKIEKSSLGRVPDCLFSQRSSARGRRIFQWKQYALTQPPLALYSEY